MEVAVYTEADCLILDTAGEVDMYAAPDFFKPTRITHGGIRSIRCWSI